MLQQQPLCLIYTVYYNNYTMYRVLLFTGDSMLTHDHTVCCSGTWYLQNDQPPLFQQYFYWIFCLPVLIFGLVFQVNINSLTLHCMISNNKFQFQDIFLTVMLKSGTLKTFPIAILVVFHKWTRSLLWSKQRKRLS